MLEGGPAPHHDDHPLLHRLYKHALADVVTAWRMAYDMPINDPRVLAITEHEAACDLLIRQYHGNRHRAERPDLAMTPNEVEKLPELLQAVRDAYDGSPLQRHLLEQQKRRNKPEAATKIHSIRLRPRSDK